MSYRIHPEDGVWLLFMVAIPFGSLWPFLLYGALVISLEKKIAGMVFAPND